MTKSTLPLPDGTKVTVEGLPEEIARIMALYSQGGSAPEESGQNKSTTSTSKRKAGPQARIRILIGDGFFDEKREFNNIVRELESRGWIYN